MNAETLLSPLSAALARFSQIMGRLRQVIGDCALPPLMLRGGPVPPMKIPLAEVASHRLRRAESRLRALAERFLAGKLRGGGLHPVSPILAPRRPAPRVPARATAPRLFIPRRFGWLINEIRHNGVACASHLRLLLAEPEMQQLLAATPRAAHILAPSCRMLGIEKELLTPVGRISEAPSAVATLPHAGLSHPPTPALSPAPALTPRDFPLLVPG